LHPDVHSFNRATIDLSLGSGDPWAMEVTLNETDRLEVVLKKFNRQITKAGLFQDMKKKRFYESPAVQRRRKSKAARRRNRTR